MATPDSDPFAPGALVEREELQRLLMENAGEFIRLFNLAGEVVWANRAVERLLGQVPAHFLDFVHPEDVELCRAWWDSVLAGTSGLVTWRVRSRQGTWRWMESQGTVLQYKGAAHVLMVCRDVTERKHAQEALIESERKLAEAQRIAHVGHWELNVETDEVTWSDEIHRIMGWRPDRAISLADFRALIHPEDRPRQVQASADAQAGIRPYDVEYRIVRPDGEVRYLHSQGEITRDASGRPVRAFGILQDITDRRRAEEALRKSERVLREAERLGQTGSWEYIVATGEIFATGGYLRNCFGNEPHRGSRPEAFLEAIHPEDRPAALLKWEQLLAAGDQGDFEYRVVWPDDSIHVLSIRATVERDASGRPTRVYGSCLDITQRRQSAEALRLNGQLLRRAEEMSRGASWTFNVDDQVLVTSEGARRLFAWDSGTHRLEDIVALVHSDDRPRVRETMQAAIAGTPFEMELRILVRGQVKWLICRVEPEKDSTGRVVRLVGISQDITARKALEGQFLQAQKMEALGRLAGGVAHDFNNLLTIINGYCELLIGRIGPDDPKRGLLDEIHTAGQRADSLTRQLLAFSRQQMLTPKVLNVSAVVGDMERMLRRVIGEDIVLETRLEPSIPPVRADAGQLQQVVINLATNARDAMPDGGRLTIITRSLTIDQTNAGRHGQLRQGQYVVLEVTDTGAGMDAETQSHLFQPFFTTKPPGKGTGLGLAVVHGIVTQSGGRIVARSEPGKGATFEVYLPAAFDPVLTGGPAGDAAPPARGTETILLVEDEDAVRGLARTVLESFGYQVLEAADGRQALAVAQRHIGTIHLLVSDVVMPHLGGRQLAQQLSRANPAIKVLFLSGYTDDAILRHGVSVNEFAFLQKPFTPTTLAQKVREVLDKADSSGTLSAESGAP